MKNWKILAVLIVITLFLSSCQSNVKLSDNAISVDNIDSVSELYSLGDGVIYGIELSPDGLKMAVSGSLGVRIYDSASMSLLSFWRMPGYSNDFTWSPDSKYIALGKAGFVYIWDVDQENEIASLESEGNNYVAWSPDGLKLATGEKSNIYVWDTENWGKLSVINYGSLYNYLAWSPDSSHVACGRQLSPHTWG